MSDSTGLSEADRAQLVQQMQIGLMNAVVGLIAATEAAAVVRRLDVCVLVDPLIAQLRDLLDGEGI
jgi:hypothetical protein